MDEALIAFRDRYASFRSHLAGEVNQGLSLIEELMSELESTKKALKQAELDLGNERDAERHSLLQALHRPFVIVIIDAGPDCHVFQQEFAARGYRGGADAADVLLFAVHHFLEKLPGSLDGVDVLVKVFADLHGYSRAFTAGFNDRHGLLDLVDMTLPTGHKVIKINEHVAFFRFIPDCKHILLAYSDDEAYKLYPETLTAQDNALGRIIVKKTSSLIMNTEHLGPLSKAPSSFVLPDTMYLATNTVEHVALSAANTVSDRGKKYIKQMAKAKTSTDLNAKGAKQGHIPAGYNWNAQSERLKPVLTNNKGRRIDKPLHISRGAANKIRNNQLCWYFYLRGQCMRKCSQDHSCTSLTDEEFDALWQQARRRKCRKTISMEQYGGEDCSDVLCIFGHGNAADV